VRKEIAEQISIPVLAIASKDEPEKDVLRFMNDLRQDIKYKHYEMFPTMEHGWLSARGDLKNEDVRKAYEEGYRILLDFFKEWL